MNAVCVNISTTVNTIKARKLHFIMLTDVIDDTPFHRFRLSMFLSIQESR